MTFDVTAAGEKYAKQYYSPYPLASLRTILVKNELLLLL